MDKPGIRDWTGHIVISFGDEGLNRAGLCLRDEMYSVMSRVDEPKKVAQYLDYLRRQSEVWLFTFAVSEARK